MFSRLTIILLSFLLLHSCDSSWENFFNDSIKKQKNNASAIKKPSKILPIVHVSNVKNRALSFSTTIIGTIEAQRRVKIFNQIEGMLIKLPFHEGQYVKKNQTIAALDKTLIQLELDKALVLEKQSILNLNRIKKLIPKNLVSKDEVSQAETLAAIAKTGRQKNQALLSYTTIKSPLNGLISERLNEPGDALNEHSHILTLIDTEQLLIKFEISELLLPDIHIGDKLNIQIDALKQQIFSSEVIRKHPTIDRISRQGIIEARLLTPPKGAMPGQLIRIHYNSKDKNYLTIPIVAIRHDQHSAFVFLLNKKTNSVSKQEVKMGITIDKYIEITDGLKSGDSIVIKGQYSLKSGSKVQIMNNTHHL